MIVNIMKVRQKCEDRQMNYEVDFHYFLLIFIGLESQIGNSLQWRKQNLLNYNFFCYLSIEINKYLDNLNEMDSSQVDLGLILSLS